MIDYKTSDSTFIRKSVREAQNKFNSIADFVPKSSNVKKNESTKYLSLDGIDIKQRADEGSILDELFLEEAPLHQLHFLISIHL